MSKLFRVINIHQSNCRYLSSWYQILQKLDHYYQAQPSLNPAKPKLCSFFTFSSHPPTRECIREARKRFLYKTNVVNLHELSPKLFLNLAPNPKQPLRAKKKLKNCTEMGKTDTIEVGCLHEQILKTESIQTLVVNLIKQRRGHGGHKKGPKEKH